MYHLLARSCLHQSKEQLSVSAPWGSPAAPPFLPGWISLRSMSVVANHLTHQEKEDFYIHHQIGCAVCSPIKPLPLLDCFLLVSFITHRQPCLHLPASPRNSGSQHSRTGCRVSCARLPFCPALYKIQVSPNTARTPQKSSIISLVL